MIYLVAIELELKDASDLIEVLSYRQNLIRAERELLKVLIKVVDEAAKEGIK